MKSGAASLVPAILLRAAGVLAVVLRVCTGRGGGYLHSSASVGTGSYSQAKHRSASASAGGQGRHETKPI
jgi:hypothetical protein